MLLRYFFIVGCFLFIVKKSYAQSNVGFENLLTSANNNINAGAYNQASINLKDALKQASATKNKQYEARAYDLLAELSIKKREFANFKNEDERSRAN